LSASFILVDTGQDDYSHPLLLVREGWLALPSSTDPRTKWLTATQVTGDLWERYLALIDQNVPDG